MKDLKYFINQLPNSWETFKLRDFMKTIDIPITETQFDLTGHQFTGIDNTFKILAALFEKPVSTFEDMSLALSSQFAKRLGFMLHMPSGKSKKKPWWKPPEEVTYNQFVTFLTLAKDPMRHLPEIMQAFSREERDYESIMNTSVSEAYADFFMLLTFVKKYLRTSARKEARRIVKQTGRNLLIRLCRPKWKRKGRR